MRIGLLLDPYGEGSPGGLGRFVFELAKTLIQNSPEDTFMLYTKEDTLPTFKTGNWKSKALNVKRIWLSAGRSLDATLDCYVFFTPIIPFFFRPARSIVFALDFAYMELPGGTLQQKLQTFFLKQLHGRSFARASHIVAITQATKDLVVKYFGISPDKISVIHLGYVVSTVTPEFLEVPEKYFLFAGVLKERKNVHGIVKAFAPFHKEHPEFRLLITGKKTGTYFESLQRLVRELGIADFVVFLGYVSDAQLAYLYQHAEAFVFPSLVEGFGMPVLEAMHAGVPVITSHRGALAEVAGDCALLVNPEDTGAITRGMQELANDPLLRQRLVTQGRERARLFTWEKAALKLHTVIYRVSNPSS